MRPIPYQEQTEGEETGDGTRLTARRDRESTEDEEAWLTVQEF